jgi:hypothetical protein
MSIIFEALKKIERAKKESPFSDAPIDFRIHETPLSGGTRPHRVVRIIAFIAVAVPLTLFVLLLIRPDWFDFFRSELPTIKRSTPPVDAVQPIIKEVRLEPKRIVPVVSILPQNPPKGEAPPQAVPSAKKEEVKLPDLRLRGISHSGQRSWAFINNKMLKVGDEIEGAKISEISSDKVLLNYKGVEFKLIY